MSINKVSAMVLPRFQQWYYQDFSNSITYCTKFSATVEPRFQQRYYQGFSSGITKVSGYQDLTTFLAC